MLQGLIPEAQTPRGSLGGEWKAAELGLSPAAMSPQHLPLHPGLLLTSLLLVIFSGPPSEMKEEMEGLKSRVEALEQVSFQHTPLPCPILPSLPGCSSRLSSASSHPCSQPGFPSAPALFLTSRWPHAAAIPAVLHAAGSAHAAALPAQQPLEYNQSPVGHPGGVHRGRQGAASCRVVLLAGEELTAPFSLQKLQLVLAPFHNLMPSAPEDVGADPISRLSHSLQQLDRIDSLSEQISFLEERLETCKCLARAGLKYFTPPTLVTAARCRPARSVTHMPLLIYISLELSSL